MSPVNKFEAIGIFVSIAVMALALGVLRLQGDFTTAVSTIEGDTQTALVAVDRDGFSEEELRGQLKGAMTPEGVLEKLVVDDIKLGSGIGAQAGDTLLVHYVGRTKEGVEFDNSTKRGAPFEFTLGEGKVIQGWERGLLDMKVGGERILVIPASLAYGNRQVGPIPPNSPLVFQIELLEIK